MRGILHNNRGPTSHVSTVPHNKGQDCLRNHRIGITDLELHRAFYLRGQQRLILLNKQRELSKTTGCANQVNRVLKEISTRILSPCHPLHWCLPWLSEALVSVTVQSLRREQACPASPMGVTPNSSFPSFKSIFNFSPSYTEWRGKCLFISINKQQTKIKIWPASGAPCLVSW